MTFAYPLILSVPKGDYKTVEFVEDGEDVKILFLTPKGKKPKL